MKRIFIGLGIAVLLFLFLPCFGLAEVPLLLVFGWIFFLHQTLSKISVEPVAIAVGVGSLILLIILSHIFAKWFYRQWHVDHNPPPSWRYRWSLSIVFLMVSFFASGISILVIIHETGWLFSSKEPIITSSSFAFRRAMSSNNLKQIGLGIYNYYDKNNSYPQGGTFNEFGEMRHSWETMLLPFMEYNSITPDLKRPWNDPINAEYFKQVLPEFINPAFNDTKDKRDYGLSHYAVNSHIMHDNFAIKREDVTDGLSRTILAGEVNANFKPWGHPINYRDPAMGLNKSPNGFGGYQNGIGANILFMDGSVRYIRNDIDPKTFEALGTPSGGETISEGLE